MQEVINFWFETCGPEEWFSKSDELDAQIKENFASIYEKIVVGETSAWRETAKGRLAEIIVLDQFARNMFRDSPKSFSADPIALILSQEAIRAGADQELAGQQLVFLYMPFMHSESALIHEQAMLLFAKTPNLKYEIKHKAIIDQFGRYPHRNKVLGRTSTAEEIEWMKSNSGF